MSIAPMNPLLEWLVAMADTVKGEDIKIPREFRARTIGIKNILEDDASGIVDSTLDFALNCLNIEYRIESGNDNLNNIFTKWLKNINYVLNGQIPRGIKALAKEYGRERWKGGSFLLLRTFWEEKEGFYFPTTMYLVNSEDIKIITDEEDVQTLGKEKYGLIIGDGKYKTLPSGKDEKIFIQKPFDFWGTEYPTPFLIKRGLFRNLKLLSLLHKKSEMVLTRALEYLLLIKKGSEQLAATGKSEFVNSSEDLKNINEEFKKFLFERNIKQGVSSYLTNFDTEIEHLIPDYRRALDGVLYEPIERRILAGLGLVGVIEGIGSSRKESVSSPKSFIAEVETGIEDFKSLLDSVIYEIIIKNINKKKYFSNTDIKIKTPPIKYFVSEELRVHLRSMFDKGIVSRRTYAEIAGNLDFDDEVKRKKEELKKGYDVLFYPPPIQNREDVISPEEELRKKEQNIDVNENNIPEDKLGEERNNYKSSIENSIYKKVSDLPDAVKNNMSHSLAQTWLNVFNDSLNKYNDEKKAFRISWGVIYKIAIKKNDKWIEKSSEEENKNE